MPRLRVLPGLLLIAWSSGLCRAQTTFDSYTRVDDPQLPSVLEEPEPHTAYDTDQVVRFPINVWGGWAPLIAANHGFAANEQSVFFQKYGVKVELCVIGSAAELLDAYARGEVPILWGTVDMMVLFAQQLALGPPFRIFQQIDWSRGGDGILVRRDRIKSANDLRGKTIALAAYGPSHYYALSVLQAAGIAPDEVQFVYTEEAFGAARAFFEDESIDACVSFAPDIYTLSEGELGQQFKLLTSTADAQRLIADVWAVRGDFADAHPDVVRGLVAGIFEGMQLLNDNPEQVAEWMYSGYKDFDIPSAEVCLELLADAHATSYDENIDFFLNDKNPTNFERTWQDAVQVWQELGVLETVVEPAAVVDTTMLKQRLLKSQFAGRGVTRTFVRPESVATDDDGILTMTVYFDAALETFDPNSVEVARALEGIARLAGKFSGAVLVIKGYTDPLGCGLYDLWARRNDNPQVPRIIAAWERRLEGFSAQRAEFVRQALTERYDLQEEQFFVVARGGADPVISQLEERWRNRRVEVTVMPLEER